MIIKNDEYGIYEAHIIYCKCQKCGTVYAVPDAKTISAIKAIQNGEPVITEGKFSHTYYESVKKHVLRDNTTFFSNKILTADFEEVKQFLKKYEKKPLIPYYSFNMKLDYFFKEWINEGKVSVLNECPHCGSDKQYLLNSRTGGETSYRDFFGRYDIESLEKRIQNANIQIAEKSLSEVKASLNNDVEIEIPINKDNVVPIQFLDKLIKVITEIDFLEKRLIWLFVKRITAVQEYNYNAVDCREIVLGELNEEKDKVVSTIRLLEERNQFRCDEDKINEKYGLIKPVEPSNPHVSLKEEPTQPVYEKAGLFNKAKVTERNDQLKKQYEAALETYKNNKKILEEYNRDLAIYQQAVGSYNINLHIAMDREKEIWEKEHAVQNNQIKEQIIENQAKLESLEELLRNPSPEIDRRLLEGKEARIVKLFDLEIEDAKKALQKALEVQKLYVDSGILYPKYLGIVCLTTMYEYFASGRCNSFTGPDGAYNIYESEVRSDRIISQLDRISSQLEDIKNNQFRLYSELKKVNQNLEFLSESMTKAVEELKSLNETSSQISYNTAETSHYAKINAELTDSLGYLIAMK